MKNLHTKIVNGFCASSIILILVAFLYATAAIAFTFFS